MDTRSMAEAKSWRTHSSRARIAAETLISTRRRYGCWRTRATKKVNGSGFSDGTWLSHLIVVDLRANDWNTNLMKWRRYERWGKEEREVTSSKYYLFQFFVTSRLFILVSLGVFAQIVQKAETPRCKSQSNVCLANIHLYDYSERFFSQYLAATDFRTIVRSNSSFDASIRSAYTRHLRKEGSLGSRKRSFRFSRGGTLYRRIDIKRRMGI